MRFNGCIREEQGPLQRIQSIVRDESGIVLQSIRVLIYIELYEVYYILNVNTDAQCNYIAILFIDLRNTKQ